MLDGSIGYAPGTIAIFCLVVIGFMALDLFAHRQDKPVSLRDSLIWTGIWVLVALAFSGYLWWEFGSDKAALFLAGYALEETLSVDNMMVFVAIFGAFGVPMGYRHRILYWGVIGAVVFRLLFVALGTAIYAIGEWVEFLFAAVILWTAFKMMSRKEEGEGIADYSDHTAVRLTRRFMPIWPKLHGHAFFIGQKTVEEELAKPENKDVSLPRRGLIYATPLFLCLMTIELSDVLFAFDSVPAIIAVTKDPLLVYTAMIFAILGLRSLYFALAALIRFLVHLEKAVVALLFFIAFKLLLGAVNDVTAHGMHAFGYEVFSGMGTPWPGFSISPQLSLCIVLGTLAVGVIASFVFPDKKEEHALEHAASLDETPNT